MNMAGKVEGEDQPPQPLGLAQNSVLKSVFTRLSNAAYTMSHQFRRLADLMQGHAALSQSRAWIMGAQYGTAAQDVQPELTDEAKQALFEDLHSRVWCTYRRDFPALGVERLDSDVGWGCTIRSGQMMMAEALSRHTLGRTWRCEGVPINPANANHSTSAEVSLPSVENAYEERLLALLSHLLDTPDASLSIHRICHAGKPQGMVPGKWLGPWVLCRALASLVNSTPALGLHLHVVCDPGGGAPTLHVPDLLAMMQQQPPCTVAEGAPEPPACGMAVGPQPSMESLGSAVEVVTEAVQDPCSQQAEDTQVPSSQPEQPEEGVEEQAVLVPAGHNTPPLSEQGHAEPTPAVSSLEVEDSHVAAAAPPPPLAVVAVDAAQQADEHTAPAGPGTAVQQDAPSPCASAASEPAGLVLLLPLTLGVGKANPLYYPQLLQVMKFPQSIGIVGGRPCASLFFVGHQDHNLLYLDPHIPQPCGSLPASLPTYFCNMVRLMPISSIDPSLAIGFYCSDSGDLLDLLGRLESLAVQHSSAPIVTIARGRQADSSMGGPLGDEVDGHPNSGSAPREEDLESWEVL